MATADATGQSLFWKNSVHKVWPIINAFDPPSRSGMTNSPAIGMKHSSAPAKTPDAVVEKLNTEINAVMKEPDSLDKLAKAGFDPIVKNVAEDNSYYNSEVER